MARGRRGRRSGCPSDSHRLRSLLGFFRGARVQHHTIPHTFFEMKMLGNMGAGRNNQEGKEAAYLFGRLLMKSRYARSTVGGCPPAARRSDQTEPCPPDGAEFKRSDDAEVSAATAHRPEQVRILLRCSQSQSCHRPKPCPLTAGCRWSGHICASDSRCLRPG